MALLQSAPTISIIVPAYNEADNLYPLYTRLFAVLDRLGESWELILINDGSTDITLEVMRAMRVEDGRIAIVNLSRNFGKDVAITAGLDHATGAAAILLDADLQDPPEVIPALVKAWREGFDIVFARRSKRNGENWMRRAASAIFYRVLSCTSSVHLEQDTGDFQLISRRVITAVTAFREHHRYTKGMIAWVGFPKCAVYYDRDARNAGSSTWNYWKLWNFALDCITGFTTLPLRVATYFGLIIGSGATVYLIFIVVSTLKHGNEVPGYPSLLAVVLFLGATQLVTLGVIGEYLARAFNEAKQRPLYLVEDFQSSYSIFRNNQAREEPGSIPPCKIIPDELRPRDAVAPITSR